MIYRALATLVLGLACLAGTSDLQAQTTLPGQAPTLDSCRDEAIRRGISGDGLKTFMDQCMRQQPASGATDGRASYDRCRRDAINRGLSGEARYDHVNECLQGSGAMSTQMGATFGQCRSQARARGLAGTAYEQFLDSCITR